MRDAFIDEDYRTELAEELISHAVLRRRLRSLQHDHLSETPEMVREVELVRSTLNRLLAQMREPERRFYERLLLDVEWSAFFTVMMLVKMAIDHPRESAEWLG